MTKYRKKPVVIEAVHLSADSVQEVLHFVYGKHFSLPMVNQALIEQSMVIKTLEGDMKAQFGDYIIKGVQGEFYPCKPDIFEATYEKVE